jgi:murein DD-endopeptidase MepM/ murein hydrolase activator NlpD
MGLHAVLVTLALVAGAVAVAAPPIPEPGAPGIPPVLGPVLRGFEPPPHPYGPGHRGVALQAAPGEAVRAALPGRITFAGEVARVGWVTVGHGGGLDTTYGPLDPRLVVSGQSVDRGQVIGRLAAEGTHLHWGARLHRDYIDPLLLLGRWEVHLVAEPVP